jgi:hypothetical protein
MRDGKESPPVFCQTKEAADIQNRDYQHNCYGHTQDQQN